MRKEILKFLVLATLAIGAGPVSAAFYEWSKTAGTNATADPSINWAEGQSPSSVNDSARAMMARLKEWGDDTSGIVTLGGTSTAYTVNTNQGLAATPANGVVICFTPGTTNGVGVTLAADSGTAFPIQSPAGTAIPSAALVAGSPYCAMFKTSSSAWLARSFYGQPFSVPLGAIIDCTCTTAPNTNFVIPIGQAISRTTYSAYFSMVGTTYGVGDGVTTFNVPDLRGRILAGLDPSGLRITTAGSGIDGTTQGATGGAQNLLLAQSGLPNVTLTFSGSGSVTGNILLGGTGAGSASIPPPSNSDSNTGSSPLSSGSASVSGNTSSINGAVGQTVTNKMPPTFMVQKILRIF